MNEVVELNLSDILLFLVSEYSFFIFLIFGTHGEHGIVRVETRSNMTSSKKSHQRVKLVKELHILYQVILTSFVYVVHRAAWMHVRVLVRMHVCIYMYM